MRTFIQPAAVLVCSTSVALVQQRTVQAVVTDTKGKAIPGATILVKGTSTGATAGVDGKFQLGLPAGKLSDIVGLSGTALLNAIRHERRVEFGEKSLRYWDLLSTGCYFATLAANARTHSITTRVVNPILLLPIELQAAQTQGITQNPGY
jgi:hypothetical protein